MNAFLNQHAIRPVIDKVYSFEEAPQAYEHLAAAHSAKWSSRFAESRQDAFSGALATEFHVVGHGSQSPR